MTKESYLQINIIRLVEIYFKTETKKKFIQLPDNQTELILYKKSVTMHIIKL